MLKSCGGIDLIQMYQEVHRDLVRLGFANDGFPLNACVDIYAKCGQIFKTRKILDRDLARKVSVT